MRYLNLLSTMEIPQLFRKVMTREWVHANADLVVLYSWVPFLRQIIRSVHLGLHDTRLLPRDKCFDGRPTPKTPLSPNESAHLRSNDSRVSRGTTYDSSLLVILASFRIALFNRAMLIGDYCATAQTFRRAAGDGKWAPDNGASCEISLGVLEQVLCLPSALFVPLSFMVLSVIPGAASPLQVSAFILVVRRVGYRSAMHL